MATRTCPQCGAQYVASVRRCIDCEVVLVDDAPSDSVVAAPRPVGEGERVSYDLEGWGNQLKVSLDGMLDNAGIKRVWDVGSLIVGAGDEDAVNELIQTVEGRDVDPTVAPDDSDEVAADLVAFEIEGLDAESFAELDAQLIAAGIPHAWSEEGDLLVAAELDEEVTALVEAVVDGDEPDDGGLEAVEALSTVWLALDRLAKAPEDVKAAERLRESVLTLASVGVPYGFEASAWNDLRAELDALVGLAFDDDVDDESDEDDEDEDRAEDDPGGAGPSVDELSADDDPDLEEVPESGSDEVLDDTGERRDEEVDLEELSRHELVGQLAEDLSERIRAWV